MVSEDSQHFGWFAEVHRLGDLRDFDNPLKREVPAEPHQSDDPSELHEVVSLRCSQWVLLEERNDDLGEVSVSLNAITEEILPMIVVPAVAIDTAAAEPPHHVFENITTRCALNDGELGSDLPTQGHRAATVDGAAKAAFSIYEPDNPP
jgi:hypothetical protein